MWEPVRDIERLGQGQESVYRSFQHLSDVDANKAKATYEDRILTLTIPTMEKIKKIKIEIE